MKNRMLSILILIVAAFYTTSYSQTPTYTCTIANDVQVSDNIYEFDIYLLRTGTTPFELYGAQFGFTYNNLIRNGGTLTASWVPGSNDSVIVTSHQVNNSFGTATPGCIKIPAKIPPGGSGTGAMITDLTPGIKVGRLRLTNTIAFAPFNPDVKFCFTTIPYPTKIVAYEPAGGGGLSYEITDSTKHFNNLVNPVLTGGSSSNPAYNCTISNDRQLSDSLYEFDIYLLRTGTIPLELSGAQFGFTFNDMIKNGGTLTASFVPGTTDSVILNSGQQNIDFNTSTPGCIKIASKNAPGGSGTGAIISNTGSGTRIGRVRLANSVPFAILTPNINFCFTSTPYPTTINAYVPYGGGGTETSITDSTKHFKNLANPQLNGGIPDYQMTLSNDAIISDSVCEFDIYLIRKGNIPFELAGAQFGFTYNNLIKNGGAITAAWVPGSTDPVLINSGQQNHTFNTATDGLIKIVSTNPPGRGNGALISDVFPGTRMGRLRITNSVQFDFSQKFNLQYCFVGVPLYATKIYAYVPDGFLDVTDTNKFIEITDQNKFVNNLAEFALPVELSSFISVPLERSVQLNWETKTEKNSDKFVIERKTINSEWVIINSVKAAGLSNSPKQYTFVDKTLQAGKYEYRLKMIDNDGSFNYSSIIESEVALPKNFELSQNFPNPFNPTTIIRYNIPFESNIKFNVFNSLGENVRTFTLGSKQAGFYELNFNSNGLSSGVYFYSINANSSDGKHNYQSTKKMILMK